MFGAEAPGVVVPPPDVPPPDVPPPDVVLLAKPTDTADGAPDRLPHGLAGVFVAAFPTNMTLACGVHVVYIVSTLMDKTAIFVLGMREFGGVGNAVVTGTAFMFSVSN
jgi:hypothetical protein